MRQLRHLHNVLSRWPRASTAVGFLVVAAVLGSTGFVRADRFPAGPVEELRQALRQDKNAGRSDAGKEFRRTLLDKRVEAIQSLGDLSQALLLLEWQSVAGLDREVEIIDEAARRKLADRFIAEIRRVLDKGDPLNRAAAAGLVGDTATLARERDVQAPIGRTIFAELAKDLVNAAKDPDPRVRLQAIRSLGRIQIEPASTTITPLGTMLASESRITRLAAAQALNNTVHILPQLKKTRGETATAGPVFQRKAKLEMSEAIVPAAVKGLKDGDAEVQRLCADTLFQTALLLSDSDLISIPLREREYPPPGRPLTEPEKKDIDFERTAVERERKELTPLLNAFRDSAPTIATAAGDSEASVRVLALRTLEELGNARARLLARAASVPDYKSTNEGDKKDGDGKKEEGKKGGDEARFDAADEGVRYASAEVPAASLPQFRLPEGQDPLLDGLRRTLRALAQAVGDPKPQVRLAAVDALEMLGDEAAPAAPHLAWALTDPDRFVRWAAARALGRMSPEKARAEAVVPYLARMLDDPDLDLRLIAAQSLERYGPAARTAVPALARSTVKGDAEIRRAAIRALVGVGTHAAPAVPDIAAALSHPDVRVRRAAAESLVYFGALAKPAEAALRQAVEDSDAEVRRHAEDALLKIR